MKKKKLLRKILAGSLAIAMVGSTALAAPVVSMTDTGITASAASSSPVVTVGDYQYVLYSDKTAQVVGYTGTKNLSTTSVGMPSVIYSKDIDTTWSYNQYIGSYDITSVQGSIFSGCKFKTLSLPSKMQALLGGFYGAEIGGFFIDSSNSYFSSTGFSGAYGLYNKGNTKLYAYPSNPELYVSGFGTATKGFPSTLTTIDDEAFISSKLKTVTIPKTVNYMGDRVFSYSSVNYITFEGDAPDFKYEPGVQVENHATFEGATSLYSITIKGTGGKYSTDSYGNLYNKDKTKLVLVPQGKTSAFNVASTCTEIGNYAFKGSNANGPVIYDQVKTIGDYAFSGVKSNFKVYCLKGTTAETVVKNKNIPYTYIYEYTTADDGVTITKYNGPYTSPSVPTSINGKSVIAIGDEAFKSNTSLTAVYMYSPIASIGKQAFYGCSNMKNVSIPYTVTDIGERAFYNCKSLTSLTLPSRLNKIGVYGFGYCTGLTSVTIPNSTTQLNYSAFYGCSGLTSVTLGTGLKTIGAYAFENTGLTSQYIPKNVTSIGSNAFGYNYSDSTHTRNSGFTSITGYPDTAAETYAKSNNITFNSLMTYSENSDGTVKIKKYTGTETSVTIPSTIGGKTVTGIEGYAFNGSNVTSITLPNTLTKIDGHAFYGASKLTSISIPSSVTSIDAYAFEFCTSLKSITIPGTVKTIGNGAFYGCSSLANVYLNSGLQTIGAYSFENTALTSVTIPKTVTTIGTYAFADNYSNSTHTGVTGFKMTGYVDTAAEEYANNNTHITFVPQYDTFVNNSTINKTTMTVGETATITGAASGGKKAYQYYVSYKNNTNGDTNILQNFNVNTSIIFEPEKSGDYTITVIAADDRNARSTKTFTVTVNAPALVNETTVSRTYVTVGDTVVINNKASGGEGEYTYAANISSNNGGSFTTLKSYSVDTLIDFVPEKSGTYIIRSFVKDGNGTVKSKDFTIYVEAPQLVNDSTVSEFEIETGDIVTVTGKASGGEGNYEYAVSYWKTDAQGETVVQEYNENTSIEFTISEAGRYVVNISVKDGNGTVCDIGYNLTVNEKAVEPLKNESTISASSVTANTEVTMNGKATGGTEPYKFAYYYKKSTDSTWTKAYVTSSGSAYTKYTEITFKPTSAGTYNVKINAKDDNGTGTVVSKEFTVKVTASEALKNNSTISATTVTANTEVTMNGKATGGTEPYKFAYYYKKSTESSWTRAYTTPAGSAYTKNTEITFKPTSAGTYNVKINAKDNNGTGTMVSKEFTVKVTASEALKNNSTVSATNVAVNTDIVMAGSATGGTEPYKFAYYYKKSTENSWTRAYTTQAGNAYTKNTEITFKPTEAGTYNVKINVKDNNGTGTMVSKDFTVTVTAANADAPLENKSNISESSIKVGESVLLNGEAAGGTEPYKFAYYYKKSTESSYSKLLTDGSSAYVTDEETEFIAPEVGTYNIRINVKDNTGKTVSKDFTLKVTK